MFKTFVCLSVFVATAYAAYDFKDSDFNELLFEDLHADFDDDLEESLRFRRDIEADVPAQKECPREKGKKDRDCFCCNGMKANPKPMESLIEVKKMCIAEVCAANGNDTSFDPFNCERMQAMKEQTVCTTECIAKKFNLLDNSGALKRDAVLTHLRTKIGENNKWQSNAVEGFVDKCLRELKASREKEIKEEKQGCNPCPLEFSHCIWREFVQGCPVEQQILTGKCKKIRESVAKGDTSHLNKAFIHHFHSSHEERRQLE